MRRKLLWTPRRTLATRAELKTLRKELENLEERISALYYAKALYSYVGSAGIRVADVAAVRWITVEPKQTVR
ncbi:hypothetical protein QYE76_005647 [Lolium multiflorum]|uniref:Uncharacterized protein n=1 Tax=Lolium multiflorum TaxID=4521 RepID=A0AAD8RV64_LOLMU|nr:hypothetical protein QYE76_005647 [Lolium multiflorum]